MPESSLLVSLVAKAMLADGRFDRSPFNLEIATHFTGLHSCIRATTDGLMSVELNAIFFLGNLPV